MFEIINNIVKELNFMKSGYLVNSAQYHCQSLHEDNDSTVIIQQQPFLSKQTVENKIVVSDDDSYANIEDSDEEDSDNEDDSDDEDSDTEDDSDDEVVIVNDDKIKVINIELGENIEINDIQMENEVDNENDNEETQLEEHFENDTSIVVTKLEGDHLENAENVNNIPANSSSVFKATKDYYARMSLNELKTLVVTKGLVSDASKMKKVQLIQLLIENP
jgi:hypothetical protein